MVLCMKWTSTKALHQFLIGLKEPNIDIFTCLKTNLVEFRVFSTFLNKKKTMRKNKAVMLKVKLVKTYMTLH